MSTQTPHTPKPVPVSLRDFLTVFLPLVYAPGDGIRLARSSGTRFANELVPYADLFTRTLYLAQEPNAYFAPAAFALDATRYQKTDCLHTRCICVDLDYGTDGHAKPSPYPTLEAAYACLVTAPVQPACIWHTGHGLQAMYLLDQPYVFQPAPDQDTRIADYEYVSSTLARMVQSDETFTVQHMFRVPLTVNAKADIPPVTGTVLYWDPTKRHSFDALRALCERYGVPEDDEEDEPLAPEPDPEPVPDAPGDQPVTAVIKAYADLPGDLRADIEHHHQDRSAAMFAIIQKMVRAGYTGEVIHDAIPRGPDFKEKYGTSLHYEIDRVLFKLTGQRGSYSGISTGTRPAVHPVDDLPPPLEPQHVPVDVPLDTCAPLPDTLREMLARYCQSAGIPVTDRILNSARFHEHLFNAYPSGVMETPCGSGKSTWALSHIALSAKPEQRYLYVVDTIDALHKAADVLEQLNPELPVGRYHGFDEDRCFALSGKKQNWYDCNPKNPASVCRRCASSTRCCYFNRDTEIQKPAVILCHSGLIRLMESESHETTIEDVRIIVDEDLNAFLSAEFTLRNLELAQQYIESTGVKLAKLLPYTLLAGRQAGYPLADTAQSFAGYHYVYRDENETHDAARLCQQMVQALRTGSLPPFTSTAEDTERARDTVYELVNFFRPSYRGDQAYAYRELVTDTGVQYILKKNRFNLGAGTAGQKQWILNASAQLAAVPYPDNMPVYGCPELKQLGNGLSLHVINGNPMKSGEAGHVATACRIIREICLHREHAHALIAIDKVSKYGPPIEQAIRDSFGAGVEIVTLPRGRIRGSNVAGECTFACLAGLSLFSTLDNVALTSTLTVKRVVPVLDNVLNDKNKPAMSAGRFRWRQLQRIYALSALDELYQTLWRTALRNGRPVEAIVVVPDAEWLSVLWRSVMPGFVVHGAHKSAERGFKPDFRMDGLIFLMGRPAGWEIGKEDVVRLLRYQGNATWKEYGKGIMRLLVPFYETHPDNVRVLRRKAVPGIQEVDPVPMGPEEE